MHTFHRLILTLLVLSLAHCHDSLLEGEGVDLSGEDWYVSPSDSNEFSAKDFSHTQWETVSLPGNLSKYSREGGATIWVRKSFDYNASFVPNNPVLFLGKIYEIDEVYLNGKIIGLNGDKPVNFGRIRIYSLPRDALVDGENSVAIRLSSGFTHIAGILSSPIGIYPAEKAWREQWRSQLSELFFVVFFLFVGIVNLLNYLRKKDSRQSGSFSALAFLFCLHEFSQIEFRFFLWDNFMVFKFLEYGSLLLLPYLAIRFLGDFFQSPNIRFAKLYLLLTAACILALAVVPNHRFWVNFMGYWALHLPAIFLYGAYTTYQKVRERSVWAYIHALVLLYLGISGIKDFLLHFGLLASQSSLYHSLFVYFLAMTVVLRSEFLRTKFQILRRYDNLREGDSLREKVFQHMESMILSPLHRMRSNIQEIVSNKDPKIRESQLLELKSTQKSLQPLMDDIIELSRLEVLELPVIRQSVEFAGFIQGILPRGSITYSIKVDPATRIENCLEFLESVVIRLIEFPAIREFTHNDLIITQDLQGHIHFRFLLFHPNPKVAVRVYNELSNHSHFNDPNTIKWQIIRQMVRLLDAKMELRILKRKYLRIDLGIQAIAPPVLPASNTFGGNIPTGESYPYQSQELVSQLEAQDNPRSKMHGIHQIRAIILKLANQAKGIRQKQLRQFWKSLVSRLKKTK